MRKIRTSPQSIRVTYIHKA